MSDEIWKGQLKELGWKYWKDCSTCSGKKIYFRRGTEVMTVRPRRDYYSFTENGKTKTGKLSGLADVIKAAKK